MAKKAVAAAAAIAAAAIVLSGCSAGGANDPENTIDGEVKGEITVLTNRTDRVDDGTFETYAKEFNKKYPDVKVKFEGVDDYDNAMKTRLNGDKYGDVLAIPAQVKPGQYDQFFEPLGKTSDFAEKYRWTEKATSGGEQFGIVTAGSANGILYNKAVFEKAGVTELPKTEDEWLAAMKKVKQSTDAVPLYTNYKDGWPLGQYNGSIGAITNDVNGGVSMAENDAPWTEGGEKGTDIYALDSLMYDTVAAGLTESDPLSTDWEGSKTQIAEGKIGAMILGSWAVIQMKQAAEKVGANPDDIGYMAWPSNIDGKQYAVTDGDYALAVSKHSKSKAAAWAWIQWFVEESGYAENEGMINTVKDADAPSYLTDLQDAGVELISPALAPEGKESLQKDIANDAGIDLFGQVYRQKLIDIARGAADGDKDSYFAELNKKWGAAAEKNAE
ncbi:MULTISPECIES: ABC transporter substrate-binding protein [unclassified Microbacterium]|uniref:ABC transporter substrate-binding protein n=1 Tax=unclassified Microbacterium TaxID=2609290 RepID=UPI0012F9A9C9|nr:extracellular solute-binding protein [Microbacterium sp. MAH-37]MVQ40684.1 extracellular solute-binding protein [Microbacterium sp. MAH-37]